MRRYGIAAKRKRIKYDIDRRSVSWPEFERAIREDVRRSTRPDEEEAMAGIAEIEDGIRERNAYVTFLINPNPAPPMPHNADPCNPPRPMT